MYDRRITIFISFSCMPFRSSPSTVKQTPSPTPSPRHSPSTTNIVGNTRNPENATGNRFT